MKRFVEIISYLTLISAMILILTVIYWLVYPYKPATIERQQVITTQVNQGGLLVFNTNLCRYTNIVPRISRYFKDGIIYNIPTRDAIPKPIGCGTYTFSLEVPSTLPVGKYSLDTTYHYPVNPLREVDIQVGSNEFTVLPKAK